MTYQNMNSMEVKKINRNRIFRLLYKEGDVSKQGIAQALNMSMPTVTQNLKELQSQDLVVEGGSFASTGGRKAKAITYNPRARFAVGVDITANHVSVVVIDLGAQVVDHARTRLKFENQRAYFDAVGQMVSGIVDNAAIDREKVLGVGISVPGLLSGDATVIDHAPVLGFSGGSIDSFAEFIPYPCMFCNDASAAGMAEFWSADHMDNMAYLSLSNSVGGSILLNRTFYAGENQRSAEFGHMTIVADGKPCYCGQRGCVDAYCNARILAESNGGELAGFFALVEAGSREHTALWEEYLGYLALTINNLRMLFDCQVVLGGYVGGYMEGHLPALRQRIGERNSFVKEGDYVAVCRYKTEASAVGAALLYVGPFIDGI